MMQKSIAVMFDQTHRYHRIHQCLFVYELDSLSFQLILIIQLKYFWPKTHNNQRPKRPLNDSKSDRQLARTMESFPEIQNVVALAKLSIDCLDIMRIAEKSESSRYNPKRFPAVIMRKVEPKSTVLVFKSGKLIIIGAKSEESARLSADKTAKDLSRITQKKIKVARFSITNIVANADVGIKVDLGSFAEDIRAFKDETFPGVIYKMGSPVKAILVFSSGKVVFTGAQSRRDIQNAYFSIRGLLLYHKKKNS